MKTRVFVVSVLVVLMLLIPALAQEKFGVKVYPGATPEKQTEQWMADTLKVTAGCYVTGDSIGKVSAFYKAQPGLTFIHESEKGASYKGNGVRVTIQNPWKDMKTFATNKTTLITIAKE